jgi:formylglycine-generating enzyme required for sulfatase activity
MPAVSGYEHDLFISYASIDDRPPPKGWVSAFVEHLGDALNSEFGSRDSGRIWWDRSHIDEESPLTEQIRTKVQKSACLVVILSKGYAKSQWCRQELEAFLAATAGQPGADRRLFLIDIGNLETKDRPAEFSDKVGRRFYVQPPNTTGAADRKRLGFPIPQSDNSGHAEFFEQVDQLAKDIHLRIGELSAELTVPATTQGKYLRALREASSYIDIRGLAVGSGKAHRFPIEELYIALRSRQGVRRSDDTAKSATNESGEPGGVSHRTLESELGGLGEVPLQAALAERRLVVIGDPGAGKTTFLRRIAAALCETELGIDPNAAKSRLGIKDKTFPIFLRCATLANHIAAHCGKAGAPTDVASPAWLAHCLAAQSRESGTGLDQAFVQQQLEAGRCTVLLDGLDEAPDRVQRDGLSQLAENLSRTFAECRFVVTSRPPAYTGTTVLPQFAHVEIAPLSDEAVDTFLGHWCRQLYGGDTAESKAHIRELLDSLHARPEIRRVARNPVMLTALAVVHWNERRLPEQRAELYESVITWLSRSRENRPGREKPERTVTLLQEVALAMHNHKDGRQTQVPKRWAAEALGQVGDPRLEHDAPHRWITIPSGPFRMGSQKSDKSQPNFDEEMEDREGPVHEVTLAEFSIARFPVTVGEYQRFMEHEGYSKEKFWKGSGGFGKFSEPEDWSNQIAYRNRPVVGVSWYEAMAYCTWAGTRLPTDAQWERAARGTTGRKYPWGNEPADATRLNFDGNIGAPTPVGIYPLGSTPEGIEDMAGNVWEWCHDIYAADAYQRRVDGIEAPGMEPAADDSKNPDRVLRGGCWIGRAGDCRAAIRYRFGADSRYRDFGFRVCLVPGPVSE